MSVTSEELGNRDIKSLLIKQAVPASIGILFMSVNILVDTIFVGQWIGSLAIAAVTVVLPMTFFISSLGMAVGIGGSSVLSRALGGGNKAKAEITFANQILMTFVLASVFVLLGIFFSDEMLLLFGAQGAIVKPAKEFFFPIIISVPFLALSMMGNAVIRAEGKAKFAMFAMIIPAFANILLDVLFIKYLDMGMFGAALATAISYFACFIFILWFFIYKSELRLKWYFIEFCDFFKARCREYFGHYFEPHVIHLWRRSFCSDLWNYQSDVDVCLISCFGNNARISADCRI
jgi:Na+-driven multidrug efflux pump